MTLDVSADYLIFDGGETVELRQVRANGNTSTTIANAVNSPLNRSAIATSGVALLGDERQWSLNASQAGSLEIQPGDLIIQDVGTDDAVYWEIVSISRRTFDTRYLCLARKQVQT